MDKYKNDDVIKIIYNSKSISDGVIAGKASQNFVTMEKELSSLNVQRGGGKGLKGFIFEHSDVATENAKNVHNGNMQRLEVINDNGIADIKVIQANGTVEYQQAKCGYETRPNVVDNPKYQNDTIVIDKGNTTLKNRLEKNNHNFRESNISKKEVENVSKLMQAEGELTGKTTATISSKLYACSKIMEQANKIGLNAAKGAGAFTAGLSMGKNFYEFIEGNMDLVELATAVGKDTAIAAVGAYGTAAATSLAVSTGIPSLIGGVIIQTPVVGAIGTTVVQIGSAITALIPVAAGPLFVLGLSIGAAITTFKLIKNYLIFNKNVNKKLSEVSRIATQALYVMEQERTILKEMISEEYAYWDEQFNTGFEEIFNSAVLNDSNGIANGIDRILNVFGENVRFKNNEEFDAFFDSENRVFSF